VIFPVKLVFKLFGHAAIVVTFKLQAF